MHGDFHTNNVLLQGDEPQLIDMATLSHGHPIMELANIHATYEGFRMVNPVMQEDYLRMSGELAHRFWQALLPEYLGSTDDEYIRQVAAKAELLATLRLISHFVRSTGSDADTVAARAVQIGRERIAALLTTVDRLDF